MNGVDVTKHLSLIKPMCVDIGVSQTVFYIELLFSLVTSIRTRVKMFLFRERSWEITCWKVLKVHPALFSLFFLKIYFKNSFVHIAICLLAEQCMIKYGMSKTFWSFFLYLISDLTWSSMTSYRNPMLCITLTMLLKWLRRNWGSLVSWIQKVSTQ